jgi:DNA-binding FadR family transcriptional regulator
VNEMAKEIYAIIKESIEKKQPGYLAGCLLPSYARAARELGLYHGQWRRVVEKLERDGLVTITKAGPGTRGEIVVR